MISFRLAELHPIVVHFPIALLVVSVTLDFVGGVSAPGWSDHRGQMVSGTWGTGNVCGAVLRLFERAGYQPGARWECATST